MYSPIGEPIAGTKLISFKVPLKDVSNVTFLQFFLPSYFKILYIQKGFLCGHFVRLQFLNFSKYHFRFN